LAVGEEVETAPLGKPRSYLRDVKSGAHVHLDVDGAAALDPLMYTLNPSAMIV
jgi:hypothetical protein